MNELIQTGAEILKYTFLNRVSQGSFGKVFKVKNQKGIYAAKVIPLIKFQEYDGLVGQLIENEIKAMKLLQGCQYIVQFEETFNTLSDACIIMEYCEGGTLRDKLDQLNCFDVDLALRYFSELIFGFQQLHKRNIIHRDMKTANILLRNNHVKIADFGFCELLDDKDKKVKLSLGSIGYEAPEILKFKEYGIEVDLFSCGIILFEMLYGQLPFEYDSKESFLTSMRSEILQKKLNLKPISEDIKELIKQMLIENPLERLKWSQLFQNPLITQRMDKQLSQIFISQYENLELKSQKLQQFGNSVISIIGQSKIELDLKQTLDSLKYLVQTVEQISHFPHKDYKIAIVPQYLIMSHAKRLIQTFIGLFNDNQSSQDEPQNKLRRFVRLQECFHQIKKSNYLARDFNLFAENRKNQDTLTLQQYLNNELNEQYASISVGHQYHLKAMKYNNAKLLKLPQEKLQSLIDNYFEHYRQELLLYHQNLEPKADPTFDKRILLRLKVHILNCRTIANNIMDNFADINLQSKSTLNDRIDELLRP